MFAANLLVVVVAGRSEVPGLARADPAGVALGLAALWAAGLAVALGGFAARDAVLTGAGVVAALQFVPCLHFAALVVALRAWDAVAGPAGVTGWFAVTVLAGLPLLSTATGAAALWSAWRRPAADGDDDGE